MLIRTFDPELTILIVGTTPIPEWNSLRLNTNPSLELKRGISGEIGKYRLKNGSMVELEITLSELSPYNSALNGMMILNLPFSAGLVDVGGDTEQGGLDSRARTALQIGLTGGLLSNSTLLYPCIIEKVPSLNKSRSAGDVTWTIHGYIISNTLGGRL